jgi:hypothetical protein
MVAQMTKKYKMVKLTKKYLASKTGLARTCEDCALYYFEQHCLFGLAFDLPHCVEKKCYYVKI